jgi:S-adenosylmethionine:tRNA ribosyltransferase-isomerase
MKGRDMTSQNIQSLPQDYDLDSYDFSLPPEQVAQHPLAERHASRLLVLDREANSMHHDQFVHLDKFLPEKCLIVTNVSKVIPARLHGRKRLTQGKVEFLLLTPLPAVQEVSVGGSRNQAQVEGLLRPAKGLKPGSFIDVAPEMLLEILQIYDFGRSLVRLEWTGDLASLLLKYGTLPLPPYIRRTANPEDGMRYQTVYARSKNLGSVAAPTAGLHFTTEQIKDLENQGHEFVDIVLYVGYGTFNPIRSQDIREHQMHSELMEISEQSAQTLQRAKDDKRPIVAVGTTAVRALESVYAQYGRVQAFCGWTDIYLYPGAPFHVVDHLITNFHLPRSSLILMVSAFAGRERVLRVYEQAAAQGYRFFSYGDAMFIK